MKKTISFILVLAMLSSLVALAKGTDTVSTYESSIVALSYESVSNYIGIAERSEELEIGSEKAYYYYGSDFTVVKDQSGYYLITFDESRDNIYVNGIQVTEKNHSLASKTNSPMLNTSSTSEWTYFDTIKMTFDVGGLTSAVAVGIIIAGVPALSGLSGILVSYFAGVIVNGLLPDSAAVTYRNIRYVGHVDADLGIYDMKNVVTIWGSTTSSHYQHLLMSTTYIQTHYS